MFNDLYYDSLNCSLLREKYKPVDWFNEVKQKFILTLSVEP